MRVRLEALGTLFSVLLFGVALFCIPAAAYAADLNLTPSTGSVAVGGKLSIQVMLDPSGDSVNASDGSLKFDSSLLSVDSISKDGSAFSLWTADPTYSNSAGTIDYSGGTPTAFSNKGKILTIVFKGKATGSASISFTKGSVLAADGKGTDVYKNGNGAAIVVTAAAAPTPAADTSTVDTSSANSSGDGSPPVAPVIASPTFPKPDTWYGTSTGTFTWTLTADVTAVRTLLSTKTGDTPTGAALKGGATTTQKVSGITDGVSYFYVQGKNSSGWGDVAQYKLQIDTVPPNTFDVAVQAADSNGTPAKLAFKTDDLLSGMDHYELIIGTTTPINILAADITDGTYPIPPQPGGAEQVTVKAFDKAGNFMVATKTLTLPAVDKPKAAATADSSTPTTSSGASPFEIILMVLLALSVGGLIAWNMYTRKITVREKEKLLAAVLEVRDKNDRIFSAMREEFEQLVNNFDEKPQLTPDERALLENIKEVLDISEELVDTGIEDLKKMVRNQQ